MPTFQTYEFGAPFCPDWPQATHDAFKAFLKAMWQNRRNWPGHHPRDAPYFRYQSGAWQAQGYAGVLAFQDWQIWVFPRLFGGEHWSAEVVMAHLDFYLKYAQPLAFGHLPVTATAALPLFEAFLAQWAKAAQDWLKEMEANSASSAALKSQKKIDFTRYVRHQLPRGRWHQLPAMGEEEWLQRPLARLCKYILTTLPSRFESLALSETMAQLRHQFGRVVASPLSYAERQALPTSSPTQTRLKDFCQYYLDNQAAQQQLGQAQAFLWLLPMARLYERFVAGFIQRHFPEHCLETQKSAHLGRDGEGRAALRVQTDLYLPQLGHILDTKYKFAAPWGKRVPRQAFPEDVYQIASYAWAYDCHHTTLLYPAVGEQSNPAQPGQVYHLREIRPGQKARRLSIWEINLVCKGEFNPIKLHQSIYQQLKAIIHP
ncbi:MAG: hypothetical protein OHK0053_04210 [Microscillaceae bacterium]